MFLLAASFDHPLRPAEQWKGKGYGDAKGLGCLEIDEQFDFRCDPMSGVGQNAKHSR
jgi:hypothetical protein